MSQSFTIRELLRVAVAEEREGRRLYLDFSGRARDDRLRQRFSRLAEEEAFHARKFEQVLERLEAETPSPSATRGRRLPEAAAELDGSDAELVRRAIRLEQAQLTLQLELSAQIEPGWRPVVDLVIREERDHLAQLSRELERLEHGSATRKQGGGA